jgi:hypothetical protein
MYRMRSVIIPSIPFPNWCFLPILFVNVDSPVLLPSKAPLHPLFPKGHYIIPDTNIFLHCVVSTRTLSNYRWIFLKPLPLPQFLFSKLSWKNFAIAHYQYTIVFARSPKQPIKEHIFFIMTFTLRLLLQGRRESPLMIGMIGALSLSFER